MLEIISLSLSIVGITLSAIALLICIVNYTDNKALQKSTHSIQYIDPQIMATTLRDENGFEIPSNELKKKIKQQDEDLFGDETVHTHINYN